MENLEKLEGVIDKIISGDGNSKKWLGSVNVLNSLNLLIGLL